MNIYEMCALAGDRANASNDYYSLMLMENCLANCRYDEDIYKKDKKDEENKTEA